MEWNESKKEKIDAVLVEIERFQKAADAWNDRLLKDPRIFSSKEGGALRRASMDLTRALTRMRKPVFQE